MNNDLDSIDWTVNLDSHSIPHSIEIVTEQEYFFGLTETINSTPIQEISFTFTHSPILDSETIVQDEPFDELEYHSGNDFSGSLVDSNDDFQNDHLVGT